MKRPTKKESVDGYARLGAAMILQAIHDLEHSKKVLERGNIKPKKQRKYIMIRNGCMDFLEGDMEPWATACGIDTRNSGAVHKWLRNHGLSPMGEVVAEDPVEEEKPKHAPAMMAALGEVSLAIHEFKKNPERGW